MKIGNFLTYLGFGNPLSLFPEILGVFIIILGDKMRLHKIRIITAGNDSSLLFPVLYNQII